MLKAQEPSIRSGAGHPLLWSPVPPLSWLHRAESPPAPGMACGPGSALTAQAPEGPDGHPPSSPTWSRGADSPGCMGALCILQFSLDKTPELVTPTPPWPSGNCLRGQSCPSPLEVPGTPWGSRGSTGQGWPGHLDQVASGHLRQPSHPPLVPMAHLAQSCDPQGPQQVTDGARTERMQGQEEECLKEM